MIRGIASVFQYIVPGVLFVGAAVSGVRAYRDRYLFVETKRAGRLGRLIELTWQDFERFVGQAFRERGFRVNATPTGPDGGIDLELRKDGELYLVQCKRWRARKVGVETVRELYGVMAARGAVGGYVVTSGEFSAEARRFAEGRNIELWDGTKLNAVVGGGSHEPVAPAPAAPQRANTSAAPACPRCGATMVRRIAKKGPTSGQAFWGCPRYPSCHGTRPLV